MASAIISLDSQLISMGSFKFVHSYMSWTNMFYPGSALVARIDTYLDAAVHNHFIRDTQWRFWSVIHLMEQPIPNLKLIKHARSELRLDPLTIWFLEPPHTPVDYMMTCFLIVISLFISNVTTEFIITHVLLILIKQCPPFSLTSSSMVLPVPLWVLLLTVHWSAWSYSLRWVFSGLFFHAMLWFA